MTTFDFGDGNGPVAAHLHMNGMGWVADTATVPPEAYISGYVYGNAEVRGMAAVKDDAHVYGNALISGAAVISGDARASGWSRVLDSAVLTGDATITDRVTVGGNAHVSGHARLEGHTMIYGDARVSGHARLWDGHGGCANRFGRATGPSVSWDAVVTGSAVVSGRVMVTRGAILAGGSWSGDLYVTAETVAGWDELDDPQ